MAFTLSAVVPMAGDRGATDWSSADMTYFPFKPCLSLFPPWWWRKAAAAFGTKTTSPLLNKLTLPRYRHPQKWPGKSCGSRRKRSFFYSELPLLHTGEAKPAPLHLHPIRLTQREKTSITEGGRRPWPFDLGTAGRGGGCIAFCCEGGGIRKFGSLHSA